MMGPSSVTIGMMKRGVVSGCGCVSWRVVSGCGCVRFAGGVGSGCGCVSWHVVSGCGCVRFAGGVLVGVWLCHVDFSLRLCWIVPVCGNTKLARPVTCYSPVQSFYGVNPLKRSTSLNTINSSIVIHFFKCDYFFGTCQHGRNQPTCLCIC